MGIYKFVFVFVCLMSIGLFSPKPLDDLTVNLNLNELSKGPKITSDEFQREVKTAKTSSEADKPTRRKTRILNGDTVKAIPLEGEPTWLDWIVSMKNDVNRNPDKKDTVNCAGALISRNHVLTSLHCVAYEKRLNGRVVPLEPEKIQIFLRSLINVNGHKFGAKKIFYYSTAVIGNDHIRDDIALIKLDEEVPEGITLNPILLPERPLRDDDNYWMAGWGATETNPKTVYPKLLKQFLQTKEDKAICPNHPLLQPPEKYLCWNIWNGVPGIRNRGACFGDSGAPGVISIYDPTSNKLKWYLQGIQESGFRKDPYETGKCDEPQSYGVDMNVWYYRDSILRWMKL